MHVTVKGKSYAFAWKHKRGYERSSTLCMMLADNTHCASAIAYCHPSDMFSKEAGRRISLARLLESVTCAWVTSQAVEGVESGEHEEAMRFAKEFRTAVWEMYWNRLPQDKRPKFRRIVNDEGRSDRAGSCGNGRPGEGLPGEGSR